jgi:hypothetical protein
VVAVELVVVEIPAVVVVVVLDPTVVVDNAGVVVVSPATSVVVGLVFDVVGPEPLPSPSKVTATSTTPITSSPPRAQMRRRARLVDSGVGAGPLIGSG